MIESSSPKGTLQETANLTENYARYLETHLAEPSETVLHHAYELGRQAVSAGISVLDMAVVHHNSLRKILERQPEVAHPLLIDKAALFFTESLSPFEMLLRRYRDSNASLLAERKVIEQQLRQIQKMEAIGQLTGGIAHDFNNLLGVVVGNVELLLEGPQSDPAQTELVKTILKASLRGAELTRRLLAFARQQPLNPRIFNLNERIPDIVRMLHRTLGESINIKTVFAENLWLTVADPSQVEDALVNLAINARDAMPTGGDLTIETTNATLDDRYAARHLDVTSGDYVVLAVTDTGIGMPPEVIERATEPFFTTKKLGQGTGLGLSMIYGFARQTGGHLKIDSKVGVGTTMRLYLPRSRSAGPDIETDANAGRIAPKGGELILVVDDNAELRNLVTRQLTGLGYQVRVAESGPQALSLISAGETIDLLFTDIGLPEGMTGYELAEKARRLQPKLKVLFTTGYAKPQKQDGNEPAETAPVLAKPYRQRELAEKVRAVLDAGSPPTNAGA